MHTSFGSTDMVLAADQIIYSVILLRQSTKQSSSNISFTSKLKVPNTYMQTAKLKALTFTPWTWNSLNLLHQTKSPADNWMVMCETGNSIMVSIIQT